MFKGANKLQGGSSVQQSDRLGEEASFVAAGSCAQCSVSPARWKEFKQFVSGMGGVSRDLSRPLPDPRPVQVLDGRQVGSDYPLCSPNCPLQSGPVPLGGRTEPDSDGGAEYRLDDGGVEGDQQLLGQVELPELSQEVQPLLSLSYEGRYVQFPLQVPGDDNPQELVGLNRVHLGASQHDGRGRGRVPPEIHHHLHSGLQGV